MKQVIDPEAAADVQAAFEWYEGQRAGLGSEFEAAFFGALERACRLTEGFEVLHRGTRRVLLHRFPYGMYYKLFGDTLLVVACLHCKEHPDRWRERT